MGSDPFENSDANKSRFVSSVLTAAFNLEKEGLKCALYFQHAVRSPLQVVLR